MNATNENAKAVEQVAESLGLAMDAKFVPFSQSRNKAEKSPSLNWLVTLKIDGREILTTDYSAGCGHCPSYLKHGDKTVDAKQAVRLECETGLPSIMGAGHVHTNRSGKPILPSFDDVLYSLVSDSDVLDAGGFEDWASNYGYDTDSRKAESIYRDCLEIALKLRSALGESGLATLRESLQGY